MLKLYMKSIQIQGIHQNTPTSHHMVTTAAAVVTTAAAVVTVAVVTMAAAVGTVAVVTMAAAIIVTVVAVTNVNDQIVEATIKRKTKRRKDKIKIHCIFVLVGKKTNCKKVYFLEREKNNCKKCTCWGKNNCKKKCLLVHCCQKLINYMYLSRKLD